MTRPFSLRRRLKPDALAALAVALAPLVYFLPALGGALSLAPDDGVIFNVPLRVAAANVVLSGSLPLWNPYLFCGMPLHGAAQAGVLFPLNWFYLAFSAPVATNLMTLSTYAVAGLGAYFYSRRAGASIAGAITSSLVWQWSGFLVAQIGHTNVIQTAALLPWLLWAVDGYGASGERRRGVLLAAVVALALFAGHQQTLVYSLLVAAGYALFMWRKAETALRASYLRSLALIAAGVALAAVQILPTLELMRNSLRAAASFDFFTSFSLPPRFFLTFLAPYVTGGGDGRLFRAPYVGPAFYGEYIGYVGLASVMLAALAFALKRDARTKFWWAVVVVALALALGRFWPFKLYGIIYYVPVLNLFRVPARHLMEIDFALAVLAGRGITAVAAATERAKVLRRVVVVCAVVFLLTCLAVTWGRPAAFRLGREAPLTMLRAPELFLPVALAALSAWALYAFARRRSRVGVVLLLAVLALDLNLWGQSSGWRVGSPGRDSELWSEPDAVRFLRGHESRKDAAPFRVLTVPQPFDPAAAAGAAVESGAGEFVLALQPDTYMMHGVENAAGYDGFGLARYSRLADDMKVWGDLSDPARSLGGEGREFDLLNVRYLLTHAPSPPSRKSASSSLPSSSLPSASSLLPATQEYGGQLFAAEDLNAPALERGARLSFTVPRVEADRVALLTNLSWSIEVPDGASVGRVRLLAEDGRTFDFDLRAGEHTSEWAYDRADIRRRIRHKRAPVATSYVVEDAQGKYDGHTYVASFALPERAIIVGGEISVASLKGSPELSLSVMRATLADTTGDTATALRKEWVTKESAPAKDEREAPASSPQQQQGTGAGRWRRVAQAGKVLIYENTRALPRAWLAAEPLVLTEKAMLDAIRTGKLPDGRAWEPRQTALVEAPLDIVATVDAATAATASPIRAESPTRADITGYEPNRVSLKTSSPRPSILVLAENHYPGWRASFDGRDAEIVRVNYNLRGVVLPAGEHAVEFRYRPKSVLAGLLISLLTAAALVLWWARLLPEEKARRALSRFGPRRV
ncbi:MAG TPA: YfhO family protein [Pyrinomonadaceae bacterium]|nr:YfhO family protein [Pyrinomonadaceae bacterium]